EAPLVKPRCILPTALTVGTLRLVPKNERAYTEDALFWKGQFFRAARSVATTSLGPGKLPKSSIHPKFAWPSTRKSPTRRSIHYNYRRAFYPGDATQWPRRRTPSRKGISRSGPGVLSARHQTSTRKTCPTAALWKG